MITLEIFCIILSLLTVCTTSNIRNGLEVEDTHALSSFNPSGVLNRNLLLDPLVSSKNSNDPKETYENWLLANHNPLPGELKVKPRVPYQKTKEQSFSEPLLIGDSTLLNRDINRHVPTENQFLNVFSRDIPINEYKHSTNPLLSSNSQFPETVKQEAVHANEKLSINAPLYKPETVNNHGQVKPIFTASEKTKEEPPAIGNQGLDNLYLHKQIPLRNQEVINTQATFQEPVQEIRNVGLPKTDQTLLSTLISKNDQRPATLQKWPGYANNYILKNPVIQDIIKNFKPDKGYLVIYPNGTVEHMNNIQVLTQKYPNHLFIDGKNKHLFDGTHPTSVNHDSQIQTQPDLDIIVNDHKVVQEGEIKKHLKDQPIAAMPQEVIQTFPETKESTILPRLIIQGDNNKYDRQTNDAIDVIDINKVINNQAASVPSLNENDNKVKIDTDTISALKAPTTSSSFITTDEIHKSNFPKVVETILNINSMASNKSNNERTTNSDEHVKRYDSLSSEELNEQLGTENFDIFHEDTTKVNEDGQLDFTELNSDNSDSKTQTNTESLKIITNQQSTSKSAKSIENTSTAPSSDRWKNIKLQGQGLDVLYLLHAPIFAINIFDGEGEPHECLQIGESESPLSYVICSAKI